MAVSYQLVMNCADSDLLARFWAEALRYRIALPPEGYETWDDFYRAIGVSEDQLDGRIDRIEDPNGEGPAIWFQVSPDPKSVPNRMHIDVHASGDRRDPLGARRERVDAEAARLVTLGATLLASLDEAGMDHYAVAMTDPEGNEFDIN